MRSSSFIFVALALSGCFYTINVPADAVSTAASDETRRLSKPAAQPRPTPNDTSDDVWEFQPTEVTRDTCGFGRAWILEPWQFNGGLLGQLAVKEVNKTPDGDLKIETDWASFK